MVGVAPKHDCNDTWNGLLDQFQNFWEVSNNYTSKNRNMSPGLKIPEFPFNKNSQ